MPYDTNSELPKLVRDHLPEHAQTIYREAFNHAWVQYAHDPAHEEIAHRVAWSAVNRRFRKAGDRRATMAPAEPLAPEALYRRGAFWMARRRRWIDLLQQDEQPRSSLRAALEVESRVVGRAASGADT